MWSRKKPGDWDCPNCGNLNFAKRKECRKCKSGRSGKSFSRRPGDWECPHCHNNVFAHKNVCGLCHVGRKTNASNVASAHTQPVVKKRGDWDCLKCGELNFASRVICRKCSTPNGQLGANTSATDAILAEMEKEKKKLEELKKELEQKAAFAGKTIDSNVPEHWENASQDETILYLLDDSSEIVSTIRKLVSDTTISQYIGQGRDAYGLAHTRYRVKNVYRVENPGLWAKYCQHKAHTLSEGTFELCDTNATACPNLDTNLDKFVNEMYLWHGTKPKIRQIIQISGFDERVASCGLFGAGVYFAENFSKSDEYVTCDSNGSGFIFLTRVCMGNIGHVTKGQTNRKRPPCVNELPGAQKLCNGVCSHTRYHSLLAEKGANCYLKKYREFIVYDRNQCYPEYLIEFSRV